MYNFRDCSFPPNTASYERGHPFCEGRNWVKSDQGLVTPILSHAHSDWLRTLSLKQTNKQMKKPWPVGHTKIDSELILTNASEFACALPLQKHNQGDQRNTLL